MYNNTVTSLACQVSLTLGLGDMRQPICGLCQRTGGSCTFPTKRKTPEFRRPPSKNNKKQKIDSDRLERLFDLLESRVVDGTALDKPSSQHSDGPRPSASSPGDADQNASATPDSAADTADRYSADNQTCSRSSGRSPLSGSSHRPKTPETFDQANHNLDIPTELSIELVRIFFDKIQPWLPLLHKPRFLARFMPDAESGVTRAASYSTEEALLLHGVFALAARYSSHPYLCNLSTWECGAQFAASAVQCYKRLRAEEADPSLLYLQGCILLACYQYTSGPSHTAWILNGVCVRLAYDLDLCNMDECLDASQTASAEWTDLEERRRAFWIVWELDTFGSTMARRPSAINRNRMAVRLPVNDEAWFAEQPVDSPILDSRPGEAWKILFDSPNQDERAWFLLANFLMAICYDTYSSRHAYPQEQKELADAVTCLNLAITQRFGLEIHPILFNSEQFAKSNWIIGMHLMLITCRNFVSMMQESSAVVNIRELSRVLLHWHPEYVSLSHPFLACALLPASMQQPAQESNQLPSENWDAHRDLIQLVLTRFASVWKLGSILIGESRPPPPAPQHSQRVSSAETGPDVAAMFGRGTELSDQELSLVKYFAIYFPHPLASKSPGSTNKAQRMVSDEIVDGGNWLEPGEFTYRDMGLSDLSADLCRPENALSGPLNMHGISDDVGEITLDMMDDWSSRLELEYIRDDDHHFNYLQL
ncbi:hypothetical protein MRS44_011854 [Fusarium solani]|uniref:uncharacterized protein n=1 Tax=Fusarium solani TaxID=169388 RepID=UPI0032C41271|nr:hypothetical protein MRS44_011854 [Fusarium solani]